MQFEFKHQQPADSTTTPADYNQIIPLLQHSNEHYKSVNFNTTPWSTIIKLPSLQSVYLSNGTSGQNYKTCRPQGATLSAATRSVTYVRTLLVYSCPLQLVNNGHYKLHISNLQQSAKCSWVHRWNTNTNFVPTFRYYRLQGHEGNASKATYQMQPSSSLQPVLPLLPVPYGVTPSVLPRQTIH
jgi:hypothetical protein